MARGRDDVNDAAFAALFDHRTRDMLREKERPGQNDLDLTLPLVEWHVDHAFLIEDSGAIHQDIDSAEGLSRRGDRRDDLPLVGHVASQRSRAATRALNVARAV